VVSPQCLDDDYWMISSVAEQRENYTQFVRAGSDMFPGLRPMLISNDKMRDHWCSLMEPRLFRRWTSSHMVNYEFQCDDVHRKVKLFPADAFSSEIQ